MLLEVGLNTSDVALEIVVGVGVRGRDHLREINHGQLLVVVDHHVELVVVTMHEAVLSQSHYNLHHVLVDLVRVWHTLHLDHGISLNKRHHDAVTVCIDGHRSGEVALVQGRLS